MKIHILSDLHVEFGPFDPPSTDADIVVLAGDISTGVESVHWALDHIDKPVIMIAGNHEYYGGELEQTFQSMRQAAYGTNVQVVNDESLIIDGVRFLCSTLWTDYCLSGNQHLAFFEASTRINDFRKIRGNLSPKTIASVNAASCEFLSSRLDRHFDGPTVVVTHHAPSEKSVHEAYRAEKNLNASFASHLDHLVEKNVNLWVHGHTHHSFDYQLGSARVICNPRGYSHQLNPQFKPDLVVEV